MPDGIPLPGERVFVPALGRWVTAWSTRENPLKPLCGHSAQSWYFDKKNGEYGCDDCEGR
jgi:hypothetical protein